MKITEISLGVGGGGGVENLVRDLSLGLAKKGNEVTVGASRVSLPGLALKENARGRWKGLGIARIRKYDLPIASLKSFTSNGLKMLWGTGPGEGKPQSPDVIHAHSLPSPGYLGRELSKRSGAPLVVTLHGGEVNILSKRLAFKALNRTVLADAQAIVAVSGALAKAAKESLGVAAKVIPNGVDTEAFCPAKGKRDLDIVFAGMLREEKGLDVLLDALESLGPEVKAGIAGAGPLEPWVRREVARRGLGTRVRMMGLVGRDGMPALLSRAKAFVLPSRTEGMSMSLLEAMSCGAVPIATSVGGNREVVRAGKDGLLVPAGDAEAFAQAVAKLISDPKRLSRMSESARGRVVAGYGLEGRVDSYISLFKGLSR